MLYQNKNFIRIENQYQINEQIQTRGDGMSPFQNESK